MKRGFLILLLFLVCISTVYSVDVLRLKMDGDFSNSNHSVTINGNPKINASNPTNESVLFKENIKFDGIDDYLVIPKSNDWDLGTENFTVDFWYYPKSYSQGGNQYRRIIDAYNWGISHDPTGKISWFSTPNNLLTSNTLISTNKWWHIALVRSNGVTKIYINGEEDSYFTDSNNYQTNTPLWIGQSLYMPGNGFLNGYIDELRISKGIARWTDDFTPNTSPYYPDSNTNLLLHFNGDESESKHTTTFNGDINMSASTHKFDGSYYFDGNGDYISIPDSNDFYFGIENFTIDAWIKRDNSNTGVQAIVNQRGNAQATTYWAFYLENNQLWLHCANSGVAVATYSTTTTINDNNWHHVAVVRNGSNVYMFIDGISQNLNVINAINNNAMPDSNYEMRIGHGRTDTTRYFPGYIDQLRISKGVARWTKDFNLSQMSFVDVIEPSWQSGFDLYDKDGNLIYDSIDQSTIQIRKNNIQKVEFTINDTINLSNVTVDTDSQRTVINGLNLVDGINDTHSLFINNNNNLGAYVCPQATTLSEVNGDCSSLVQFSNSECDGVTEKSGFYCSNINGMYKISGLTGSGIGEACISSTECDSGLECVDNICQSSSPSGAVPEFSTYILILSIMITISGIFIFRENNL